MRTKTRALPASSMGWYRYYAAQYNKTQSEDAMYLAQLNLLFYLAFGNDVVAA